MKLLSAAVLLTGANFIGKLLGFFRDILISNYYGSTIQTDAFFLAFSIPTILIGVFTSSADSSIVPQYTKIAMEGEGRREADRYFTNIVTLLTLATTAISILILLFPEKILFLFAPTFQGEVLRLACGYLRLFSFVGLFHVWYCFFCAYLLCYERTGARVILSMSTNVIVVLSLLCIHDVNMYGVSIAYLASSLLSAVIPLWSARRAGFRYVPTLSVRQHHFPEFMKLFLPIMGSTLLADLLLFCDRFLASFLAVGSISTLNYGSKIISIFDNILVVGVGAVLLPTISRLNAQGDRKQLSFTVSAVSFCAALFLLPIAILSILYAREITTVVYLRGAFTAENAQAVSQVIRAYGMQILFLALQIILLKTFHSMQETRWPFRVSLITFFTNVILSILLMQVWQIAGIALATTASTFVGIVLQLWQLNRRIGLSSAFFSWKNSFKFCVCALFLLALHLFAPVFSSSLLTLLLSGGLSALLYCLLAAVLFRKELGLCKQALMKP